MDGITILSTREILTIPEWCEIACVIILVTTFMIGCVLSYKEKDGMMMPASIAIGMILILIIMLVSSQYQVPTGKYEYKVLIDEDVNFVEFYNKYSVASTDGDIYTITEK